MFGHDDNDESKNDLVTVAPATDTGADTGVGPAPIVDTPTAGTLPSTEEPLLAATAEPEAPASSSSPEDADLLSLKKQALEELSPLVDHLDQTPEEKFKTTMMMIQATDSSSLIKSAHEAAQKIEDEKVRAQALLDIVNEINYFTQK
jgi:hypothetical protein